METVKFGFDTPADANSSSLVATVPQRVQEDLEYYYGSLLRTIRKDPARTITTDNFDIGRRYRIDSHALGRTSLRGRHDGLRQAMQLIMAVQHTAIRHELADPRVRLITPVRALGGVFSLVATVDLGSAAKTSAELLRANAQARMVATHRDLLNPHGDRAQSARLVATQIYPGNGILLGVGQPREVIKAKYASLDNLVFKFEGEVSSHEHSLILMAGAVALAEAAELATE